MIQKFLYFLYSINKFSKIGAKPFFPLTNEIVKINSKPI